MCVCVCVCVCVHACVCVRARAFARVCGRYKTLLIFIHIIFFQKFEGYGITPR